LGDKKIVQEKLKLEAHLDRMKIDKTKNSKMQLANGIG